MAGMGGKFAPRATAALYGATKAARDGAAAIDRVLNGVARPAAAGAMVLIAPAGRGDPGVRRGWLPIGRLRMRLPVAAKIALQSAGANGGSGGSPTPLDGTFQSRRQRCARER